MHRVLKYVYETHLQNDISCNGLSVQLLNDLVFHTHTSQRLPQLFGTNTLITNPRALTFPRCIATTRVQTLVTTQSKWRISCTEPQKKAH